MSSDTVVRARIDSDIKARATEALQAMGLSVSDAIRLLLVRVAEEQRLPFDVKVPNRETLDAVRELEEGRGKRFDSAEELFRDLRTRHAGPGPVDQIQARCEEGREAV